MLWVGLKGVEPSRLVQLGCEDKKKHVFYWLYGSSSVSSFSKYVLNKSTTELYWVSVLAIFEMFLEGMILYSVHRFIISELIILIS